MTRKYIMEPGTRKLRHTTETIIALFIEAHGNRYDYSLVDYAGCEHKVKIICKEHGIFEQTPTKHWRGNHCPCCAKNINYNKLDRLDILLQSFNKIHNNKYNYSFVVYKGARFPVDIICKIHNKFSMTPTKHKLGYGCPECDILGPSTKLIETKQKRDEAKKKRRTIYLGTIEYHVVERINNWRRNSCVPSDLTTKYLVDLYYKQDGLCYYTNINMIVGSKNWVASHNSLSLDKLNPKLGYVQGNVVWCTYLANTMKQNLTEQEFYDFISNILNIKKSKNENKQ